MSRQLDASVLAIDGLAVVEAITSALRLFRPEGSVAQGPDPGTELERLQGRVALFELLAEIAAVDPLAPWSRQTAEQRRLGILKQDLGELIGQNDARDLWKFMGIVVKMRAVGLITGSPEIGTPRLVSASQPTQAKNAETDGGNQ